LDIFQGSDDINLQPGDSNVPYRFNITVASSSKKNDGYMPFGSTLHKSTASAHHSYGSTSGTSDMIGAVTLSSNEVVIRMNWVDSLDLGLYHMKITITSSVQGSTTIPMVRQLDFNRVYLRDR